MRTIDLAQLGSLVGREAGVSGWLAVSQDRIDRFADATGDHQWIHLDAGRAARETPFGGTIAHGFLTLSLVSALLRDVVAVDGVAMSINYGLDRVRFVSPVPAGARIRARVVLRRLTPVERGAQALWDVTVEREGGTKPCLVAEWIVRYFAE